MSEIRVRKNIKRITVNDDGDYIELNFSDSSLPDKFYGMLENIQRRVEDYHAQMNEISEKFENDKEAIDRNAAALYRQIHETVVQEIDNLFGPDTCKKVFGDIVPDLELFEDFFNQLAPNFEEYGRNLSAKLSKYSAERTGNV